MSKQWFSFPEAADKFGVSYGSFCRLVKRHASSVNEHVQTRKPEGSQIPRRFISREGMVVLKAVKGNYRGNQFRPPSMALSATDNNSRKHMAEQAMSNNEFAKIIHENTCTMQTIALAMSDMLTAMTKLIGQVADLVQRVEARIPEPELKERSDNDNEIKRLPMSPTPPAPISKRGLINQRVRAYIRENPDRNFSEIWNRLYNEMYYRHSFNAKVRAGEDMGPLDAIDEAGLMNELWNIACSMLKISTDQF